MGPVIMDHDIFSVTWPSYTDHLKELLHDIWNSNELTDVTIFCEDKKQFNVHKIVLSACSPVFKSIIHETNMSNQVIYLRGIHSKEMESILRFIYLGQSTFHQERIEEFLNVAKILEIKEISKNTVEVDTEEKEDDIQTESERDQSFVSMAIQSYVQELGPQEEKESIKLKPKEEENCVIIKPKEEKKYRTIQPKEDIKNITIKVDIHGQKYSCDECQKKFKVKNHLKRHKLASRCYKYICDQCDFKTIQERYLKDHIQIVHDQIKFSCDQCDY